MAEASLDTPSLVGIRVGHYSVRRKIGQGGMGVVYEGWDERLERKVALKAIRDVSESADARARLWREARSLAQVSHPHVCQVFDVLEEDKLLVVVLELLEGQSLAERLATSAVATSDAITIAREILLALEALHVLGIVHRDLKPSNVFLTRHGSKLLDFGLARSVQNTGRDGDGATALTLPGLVVGTPQYMSPEQASGNPASPASDIFAAGCVLYEMLTGKCPFEGPSPVDVLYAVLHHNPQPLSGSRAIEALDQVIRRALSKRPEHRYGSAREMLQAMTTVRVSSTTAVATRTRTVARMIALPFRVLKKDDETDFLAYSLPDAISNSLSGLENLIVRSTGLASRWQGPPDPKQVAAEAEVDAFLTGSLMHAGGCIRLSCQLVEAPSGTVLWSETVTSTMRDLFKIEDELSHRVVQSLMLPLSDRERRSFRRDVPASAQAYEYYLRANQITLVRTVDNMRLARDLYKQCLEEDPNYAPVWARLGRVYGFLEKFSDDSGRDSALVKDAFQRAFALNPDLPLAHNLYTPTECDQGQAQQAMVRLLHRARFRRNDADLFAGLVQACRYCDELEASVAAHERASHLDPQILDSVAHTYFLLGDYQRTLACYGTKAGYYLDCAALAALGDMDTALAKLQQREQSAGATGTVRTIMLALQRYLEGNIEECIRATQVDQALARKTPESFFYLARQLARIPGQEERTISLLLDVIASGFLCGSALTRDPWLEGLRPHPRFFEVLSLATRTKDEVHAAFLAAGGQEVLANKA
ncbi:MAG TPA: protein kinase [Terriglobales bacterium]|nr:protein kinase [Terriglobales bacterium]